MTKFSNPLLILYWLFTKSPPTPPPPPTQPKKLDVLDLIIFLHNFEIVFQMKFNHGILIIYCLQKIKQIKQNKITIKYSEQEKPQFVAKWKHCKMLAQIATCLLSIFILDK